MGLKLDDLVNAHEVGLDLTRVEDLTISTQDYGLGKEITGLIDSTLIGVAGNLTAGTNAFNTATAHSFYNAINSMIEVPSSALYNFFLPWASFGTGIGYALAETRKQKFIPGASLAALTLYSIYKTTTTMGVSASYIFSSGVALTTVLGSALPPVFALFGVGWLVGAAYKKYREKKAKKKSEKKKK